MATKYAGQNALNKLMQIIKTALNNKADKSALDEKLDKSGGKIDGSAEITGSLKVGMSSEFSSFIKAGSGISSDMLLMAPIVALHDPAKEASVYFGVSGENAAKVTSPVSGGGTQYARLAVGTPTGDNDATTKSYVESKVSGLQTADQVQAAISSAISGVYTPKGSISTTYLPAPSAENVGWVYNIANAFTTTDDFLEGKGHDYLGGTNVACVVANDGSYKWDVLAGIIDLKELTAAEVQTLWDSV